jgi:K+-transporting ATPase ATPase C chain
MKTLWRVFSFFLVCTLICGAGYTALVTGLAQLFWPYQSGGSLVVQNNRVLGSALVAQPFSNLGYFWPRPSSSGYSALPASGSNLGPTSAKLKHHIANNRARLSLLNHVAESEISEEMLTFSASGLDPHILASSAVMQVERIARARQMGSEARLGLLQLIGRHSKKRLGFLGEDIVNVFLLNLALDQL